jgi:hypothetical protein
VISADCHAAADLRDYKPFLETRYHDAFDDWADHYVYPFADLKKATAYRIAWRFGSGRRRTCSARGQGATGPRNSSRRYGIASPHCEPTIVSRFFGEPPGLAAQWSG